MKKVIAFGIIFLLVVMSFTSISGNQLNNNIINSSGRGDILYVGGSGEGNYTSIQDAIDNASDGDTVFVFDDSSPYIEPEINIDYSINLIGENALTTCIDGSVFIDADDVLVNYFTIRNEKNLSIACLKMRSNISNNIIYNNNLYWGGILLGGKGHRIINNTIYSGKFTQMSIWGNGNNLVIKNNKIISKSYSEYWEVYADISIHIADNIIITNNTLISESHANDAIDIDNSCSNSVITGNIITGYNFGVKISGGKNNVISDNIFQENDISIILFRSRYNDIFSNSFFNNDEGVILSTRSWNNEIFQNNFIGNRKNADFNRLSIWNTWDGNYWDKPRTEPYMIIGKLFFFFIPWFDYDYNPAEEPYDIGV